MFPHELLYLYLHLLLAKHFSINLTVINTITNTLKKGFIKVFRNLFQILITSYLE